MSKDFRGVFTDRLLQHTAHGRLFNAGHLFIFKISGIHLSELNIILNCTFYHKF